MRDPNRIDKVLDEVKALWEKNPDLRLGQLFCNLQSYTGQDLFYVEDSKLVEIMKEFGGLK